MLKFVGPYSGISDFRIPKPHFCRGDSDDKIEIAVCFLTGSRLCKQ
jgi:hypothetical protein